MGYRDDEVAFESRIEVLASESQGFRRELEALVKIGRSLRRRIARRRALDVLLRLLGWSRRHWFLNGLLLLLLGVTAFGWIQSAREDAARKAWMQEAEARGCHGTLKVEASLDDAVVFVNDQYAGAAPVELRVCPGHHVVRAVHRKTLPWRRELTMPSVGTVTLGANLIPWNPVLRPRGGILFLSEPPEALLFVDGEEVGPTPAFVENAWLAARPGFKTGAKLRVALHRKGYVTQVVGIRMNPVVAFDLARDPKTSRPVEKGDAP
jgi:hypothetical protein